MMRELRAVWIAGILVAAAMLSAGGVEDSPDDPAKQSKPYVTTQGIVGTCAVHDGMNVGNACFILDGRDLLDIGINDRFFDTVRGMYRIFDGPPGLDDPPDLLEQGLFCTSVEGVPVPDGAESVIVFVDGHIPTWFECGSLEGASIGEIVLTEHWNTTKG